MSKIFAAMSFPYRVRDADTLADILSLDSAECGTPRFQAGRPRREAILNRYADAIARRYEPSPADETAA